jgi:hypothetical protein
MGLLGAYSNPEIQGRLRQLSEKLDRLAASHAAPRPSTSTYRRTRIGLIPGAIKRVLGETPDPMRARDIHMAVEELLGMPVPASSVKNWLATHTGGEQALFVRLGRGRYQIGVPNSGEIGTTCEPHPQPGQSA